MNALAIPPACRRWGDRGPVVVCLHANASSGAQWRALGERLAPSWRVLAPDLLGAGASPRRPVGRAATLDDEAGWLAPLLDESGSASTIVGHSYGGALALALALRRPDRVHALALYEPTWFALVDADAAPPNAADGIRHVAREAAAAVAAGDAAAAARRFIDYWMGDGAWDRTPPARRGPIEGAIADVGAWAAALFGAPPPAGRLAALDLPVLLMRSCASPASALAVVDRLAALLPRVHVADLDGCGHMAPVTHPDRVNPLIEDFLRRPAAGRAPGAGGG